MLIGQWIKQTLCVIYYTEFILGSIGKSPVLEEDTLY